MSDIFRKIEELAFINSITKHQQIVQGIVNAIDEKLIFAGDVLPPVNTMVEQLGFARKTIVKAYTELKHRGLIEAKNRQGYFVCHTDTKQTVKVMLLLYAFDFVQRSFFKAFREAAGPHVQIDTFFHHNNPKVFRTFVLDNLGKYGLYVVAPIHHAVSKEVLQLIPPKRLLLVDRYENLGKQYAFVAQQFEQPIYEWLLKLKESIFCFDRFVLFYRDDSDYPSGTAMAFRRFVQDHGFTKARVERAYTPGSIVSQTLYYTINDSDLWPLLKDCRQQGLRLGKDIGIISQDDTPVKELIMGGITTISGNFEEMAQLANTFLEERKIFQTIVPTLLCRRTSF